MSQKNNNIRAWEVTGLITAMVILLSLPVYYFTAEKNKGDVVVAEKPATFVTSVKCKDCHKKEYDSWQGSHHDLAMAVAGKTRGGPGKVAVIGSMLFGSISSSAAANVVVTGSVTIPMMKQAGFKPYFAGAVEATASTGGHIMPPITRWFFPQSYSGPGWGRCPV